MTQISDRDIADCAKQFEQQREQVRDQIRTHLMHSGDRRQVELGEHLARVKDWAIADLVSDQELGQIAPALHQLHELDEALARIRVGSFGLCHHCGQALSLEYVRATPLAKNCDTCAA